MNGVLVIREGDIITVRCVMSVDGRLTTCDLSLRPEEADRLRRMLQRAAADSRAALRRRYGYDTTTHQEE